MTLNNVVVCSPVCYLLLAHFQSFGQQLCARNFTSHFPVREQQSAFSLPFLYREKYIISPSVASGKNAERSGKLVFSIVYYWQIFQNPQKYYDLNLK